MEQIRRRGSWQHVVASEGHLEGPSSHHEGSQPQKLSRGRTRKYIYKCWNENRSTNSVRLVPLKMESNLHALNGRQPQWLASKEQHEDNRRCLASEAGSQSNLVSVWGLSGHQPLEPSCHGMRKPRPQGEAACNTPANSTARVPADSQNHSSDSKRTGLQMLPFLAFELLHMIPSGAEMSCPHQALPKLQIQKQNKHYCFKLLSLEVAY